MKGGATVDEKGWTEFFDKLNAIEKRLTALEEAGQSEEIMKKIVEKLKLSGIPI